MTPICRLSLLCLCVAPWSCARFDDYPVGDLCERAERDDEGRAVRYPEWRICPPLNVAMGGSPGGASAGPGGAMNDD